MFESYYLRHHSGRKLTWHSGMEQCTLKAFFPQCGERELVVSVHQAAVLLLFVKATSLSFNKIFDATALPEAELKRTLQSLALGKVGPPPPPPAPSPPCSTRCHSISPRCCMFCFRGLTCLPGVDVPQAAQFGLLRAPFEDDLLHVIAKSALAGTFLCWHLIRVQ